MKHALIFLVAFVSICHASPLRALLPNNRPKISRTIKARVSVDLAPAFGRQMKLIESRRDSWLQQAEKATPKLLRKPS